MKTLDEIIQRDDYYRATSQLITRAREIAEKACSKFVELDLFDFDGFVVAHTNPQNSYRGYVIAIVDNDINGYGHAKILNTNRASSFTNQDGIFFEDANTRDFLRFLNAAKSLFINLDKQETEQVAEIESVMKSVESM